MALPINVHSLSIQLWLRQLQAVFGYLINQRMYGLYIDYNDLNVTSCCF